MTWAPNEHSDRPDVTERRADRVSARTSVPGIAALETAVEGSIVHRDSPDFEVLRKPAWAQFENITRFDAQSSRAMSLQPVPFAVKATVIPRSRNRRGASIAEPRA
jgi:hypothetical protein